MKSHGTYHIACMACLSDSQQVMSVLVKVATLKLKVIDWRCADKGQHAVLLNTMAKYHELMINWWGGGDYKEALACCRQFLFLQVPYLYVYVTRILSLLFLKISRHNVDITGIYFLHSFTAWGQSDKMSWNLTAHTILHAWLVFLILSKLCQY